MDDNVLTMRKRLIFRSWHRGTREIDLMLGKFAEAHLPQFSKQQLAAYDRFLNNSDPDIFSWITGQEPLPPAEDNEVTGILLKFFRTAS